MKKGIDARKYFEDILKNYGHNVLLRRKNSDGTYANQYERHTVRYMYPKSLGLTDVDQEQIEGLTYDVEMVYYFKWDAHPQEGDIIYEYDERYEGFSLDKATKWEISFAVPMRGTGGRIEYYVVGCDRIVPH